MKHEQGALRRGMMRLVQGKLGGALGRWREVASEMKDEQRKLSGALQRLLHRALSAGFETWQANAECPGPSIPFCQHSQE